MNNKWYHVHQKRPGPTAWIQWRRACRLFSTRNEQVLHRRLGDWTVPAKDIRRHWPFWLNRHTNLLYRQNVDQDICEANLTLPAAAVPVDVTVHQHTWSVAPHYIQWQLPIAPEAPAMESISDIGAQLPEWEQLLFQELEILVPDAELLAALEQENVVIGSDGSQIGPKASFSWVMSNNAGRRLARCAGPCFGLRLNSYRAEGYGLLSVCRFLLNLKQRFNINMQQASVFCDNKSMVNRTIKSPRNLNRIFPNETLSAEWDVLMEIWYTRYQFGQYEQPTFSHIKGHQDRKKPYAELSLAAQLNVDADALAGAFLRNHPTINHSRAPMFPHTKIHLHLAEGTVTHKIKRAMKLARSAPPLRKKLQVKYGWSDEVFCDINWEASRQALNGLRAHRVTLIKHLNNITPVGKLVNIYDKKYPAACPSCPEIVETRKHLYLCPEQQRDQWRKKLITKLRKDMDDLNTHPGLQELLLEGIKSVLEGRDANTIHIPAGVEAVAQAQSSIGWTELLKGRMSIKWSQVQQQYLGAFDPKKNGTTWTVNMIRTILKGWLEVWEIRNKDRHGRDRLSKAQADRAQAIRELEQLYELKDQVLPQHNWILTTPFQQRLNLKTYSIRAFINCYKPILEESYQVRLATG
jgi:hypothetical protein